MALLGRVKPKIARQRTLKSSIHCSGVALHSGARVSLVLHPAAANSGIQFRRSDLSGPSAEIKADWRSAIDTPLCTTLENPQGTRVSTVEHLMSALYGCGVDNALVELNGSEVPAVDGSAAPFVFLIECAGLEEQDAPRRALRILKKVESADPHRSASLEPGEGFSVGFEIQFDSKVVDHQVCRLQIDGETYKRDIARARTFGFLHEIDKLREMGLAKGGSLENAIVVNGSDILNEGGLRYEDEFVRHKMLDSIGDLYLAGGPIIGHFNGHCAGHTLTLRLLRELFADESAWEWCEMAESALSADSGAAAQPDRAVASPAA